MINATVYLIGAGPGDPELLTIKAKRLLEMADVVLYDYLAHPNAVMLAKNAEKICVGKKKGANSMKQDDIHQLMLDYSKKTTHIVRLKGGDPMVFGRCGEEMAFLKQHNIQYEIVPGISSAIAAPTYAGIPITQRGVSQSVAFVTATREHDVQNMNIPTADTLVMMMSLLRLDTVVDRLLETLPPTTPIAIIESGTLANEKQLIGTLETIVSLQTSAQLKPPALLIVGDVAALGSQFNWRDHLPLKNRRFVLFRALHQQSRFRDMLHQVGGEVLTLPLNNIQPVQNPLKTVDINTLTHIIFTSENGVREFMHAILKQGLDARAFAEITIVAIGNHTNACLNNFAIAADIIPDSMNSDGIVLALKSELKPSDKVLIPTSSEAGTDIIDGLECTGAAIEQIAVYTNASTDALSVGLNWVSINDELIFMNAASVRRFFGAINQQNIDISKCRIFSIGPKTTAEIKQFTQQSVIEAKTPELDCLISTIINH